MNVTKIIVGTGIGAGIIWFISSLLSKKKVGDKLDTVTTAMVHSLDLKGIVIRIDIILKNPTEGTLTIRQPYVKVFFENKQIGASQLTDNVIVIAPFAAIPMKDPIYLTIPATGLLTLGNGLYKLILKKQPAKIKVITVSSIKIGKMFVGIPDKVDEISLNLKK